MKKTKKLTIGLMLLMLACVVAACFCACSDGANGLNGTDGKDGTNGKSAYEIWLDNGHTGTEADFLEWLKGSDGKNGTDGKDGSDGENGTDGQDGLDGKSAYEIFMQQYPYYKGTEGQWLIALVNGQLRLHEVTFKSEVADDIVKYVIGGYALTDIPKVPEKEGQTSAVWNVTDFSNITTDMTVTAVYDMRKYVTFHNEFTEDEDIVKVVNYNETLTDIPTITAKAYNDSKWSVTDFSCIKTDLQVEAVYETQGLQFTAINQQTVYKVSKGNMNLQTEELFIPAEHNGKPVTVIDSGAFAFVDDAYRVNFSRVYIPGSITEIRVSAFYCSISFLKIPQSVETLDIWAFQGTVKTLELNINLSYYDYSFLPLPDNIENLIIGAQITEIDENYWDYWNLKNITVDPDNKIYRSSGNCLIEIASKTLLRGTNNSVIPADGSVTQIRNWAFANCSELKEIVIPSSVISIGDYAFSSCSALQNIIISNGVKTLGAGVFQGCKKLNSIVIPKSVIKIHCGFINENIINFYYCGSKSEFEKIEITVSYEYEEKELYLPEATVIYYYSETKPTTDGFYWHYDIDGITPIVWRKDN